MKYFLDFKSREDVEHEFNDKYWYYGDPPNDWDEIPDFPSDEEIIFASYAPGCYCGDAVVVYMRDGRIFMVEASHCSCYGLEGQWDPHEIAPEQLLGYTLDSDHGEDVRLAWDSMAYRLNNVQ